ncbi:MAG: tRNA synthetase class [Actinomycetia bacterium]|nr:tRNA synthetase class [Actinomycetes bacterium]
MTQSTPATDAPEQVTVRGGLATIGPELLGLRAALEERFTRWAAECGALPTQYPPLMRVEDLHRLDYFHNFPQLAILGSGLDTAAADRYAKTGAPDGEIPAVDLSPANYALPSAACYNIYLDLAGSTLAQSRKITTVATCFRRETHYDALRRLLSFSMREIVCVGERDAVLEHIRSFKGIIGSYLESLGLPVEVEAATDPFFDSSASRALTAKLFPVKEEFVFDGSLAIASVNFHRNFFGERCDMRIASGEHAFSGCVAFGIERWISALTQHFGETPGELSKRVLAS